MPFVMGSPWMGGYIGSLEFGIEHSAVLHNTVLLSFIPTIQLSISQTHDMSQYIDDPLGIITNSRIVNLDITKATYSHATKLLTAVANGISAGLQLEVTYN